ncbi:MAG: hypothetical protein ACI4GV_01355 [Acutalibacteraceae bacterium]
MYNINFVPDISVGVFGYEFNTKENWVGQVTGNLQDGSFFTDIDAYTLVMLSLDSVYRKSQPFGWFFHCKYDIIFCNLSDN